MKIVKTNKSVASCYGMVFFLSDNLLAKKKEKKPLGCRGTLRIFFWETILVLLSGNSLFFWNHPLHVHFNLINFDYFFLFGDKIDKQPVIMWLVVRTKKNNNNNKYKFNIKKNNIRTQKTKLYILWWCCTKQNKKRFKHYRIWFVDDQMFFLFFYSISQNYTEPTTTKENIGQQKKTQQNGQEKKLCIQNI